MRPSVQQPKQDKWYQESLSEILPARAVQRVLRGRSAPGGTRTHASGSGGATLENISFAWNHHKLLSANGIVRLLVVYIA